MKKLLSLVLCLTMVLTCAATMLVGITAFAEGQSWSFTVDAYDSELTAAGVYTTYDNWLASNPWWKYSFQLKPTGVANTYTVIGSSTEGKCTAELGDGLNASTDASTVKSTLGFQDGVDGAIYITLATSTDAWYSCYYCNAGDTVVFESAPAVGVKFTMYEDALELDVKEETPAVEDKVINLLEGTNNDSDGADAMKVSLENGVFTVESLTAYWPSTTLTFSAPVTVPVEGTYVEFEAVIEDAHALWQPTGSIRLNSDEGSVWLHQFGENPSIVNSGDANPGTISYKLPLSELGYINDDLVTSTAISAEEVTFNNLVVFAVNGAKVTVTKLNLVVPGTSEGGSEGGEAVVTKGDNVALNKTYTLSGCGERTAYYAKLTDGVAKDALSYNSDEWFGFYCNGEDATVINAPDKVGYAIIDLGEVTNLYSVRVNLVNNLGAGIAEPEYVKVYVSNDGETFNEAGTFETKADENTAYWSEVSVDAQARYVKVEIKLNAEKSFAFINEIEVYEATVTAGSTGTPGTGDAGIYAIAGLALVAILGTAVVIKKRA